MENTDTNVNINVDETIQQMASALTDKNLQDPLIVGIHTGGVWVAEQLNRLLNFSNKIGKLDISFHRDDFGKVGLNPEVRSSKFHSSVEDRNIILVDDVLYTGRTIRAAMNEIFSYGRPRTITLAVLVDRSGRELPVQADIVGCEMNILENQQVKLINNNGKPKLKTKPKSKLKPKLKLKLKLKTEDTGHGS